TVTPTLICADTASGNAASTAAAINVERKRRLNSMICLRVFLGERAIHAHEPQHSRHPILFRRYLIPGTRNLLPYPQSASKPGAAAPIRVDRSRGAPPQHPDTLPAA